MTLDKETLKAAVKEVWIRSLTQLQPDVEEALVQACDKETNERAKKYLGIMLDNARIAKKPFCYLSGYRGSYFLYPYFFRIPI